MTEPAPLVQPHRAAKAPAKAPAKAEPAKAPAKAEPAAKAPAKAARRPSPAARAKAERHAMFVAIVTGPAPANGADGVTRTEAGHVWAWHAATGRWRWVRPA